MEERKDRISRRWRAVALIALGLAVGIAMTATPATAHLTSSFPHLMKHMKKAFYTKKAANKQFINVGEKATSAAHADNAENAENAVSAANAVNAESAARALAADNADRLGGMSSSAFAAASHNHDTRYVGGGGASIVDSGRRDVAGSAVRLATLPGLGYIDGLCSSSNPSVRFTKTVGGAVASSYDDGGANPSFAYVESTTQTLNLASPSDQVVWQLSHYYGESYSWSGNVATVVISVRHPFAGIAQCRFTAQAVTQNASSDSNR